MESAIPTFGMTPCSEVLGAQTRVFGFVRTSSGEAGPETRGTWQRPVSAILRGWGPRVVTPRRPWRKTIGGALLALAERLAEWQARAKSRRSLLTLDDRALRDIGLDRATAHYEGAQPFWR